MTSIAILICCVRNMQTTEMCSRIRQSNKSSILVMPAIRKLKAELYTHLRSQVIIESIADVVRELIRNSVDAGASNVSIYLDLESLSVCVEDNGAGVLPCDMRFVGKRYYTTKYFDDDKESAESFQQGLGNLPLLSETGNQTLGFRGEALSCIADQCSKLILVSAFHDMVNFSVVNGENLSSLIETLLSFFGIHSPIQGTVVVASRLFHNMPVRMKYVRAKCHKSSIATEIKNMIFQTFAHRSFTSITATFVENGKQQIFLSTGFHSDPERLFSSLFNASLSYLRNIRGSQDGLSLEGFFGVAHGIKSSRNFIFCNGIHVNLTHKKTCSIRSVLNLATRHHGVPVTKSARIVMSVCFSTKSKTIVQKELSSPVDFLQIKWAVFLKLLKFGLGIPPKDIQKSKTEAKEKKLPEQLIEHVEDDEFDQTIGHALSLDPIPVASSDLLSGNFKLISQVDRLFILANISGRLCALDQHACDERVTVEGLFKSYMEQASDPGCDLRVQCKTPIPINNLAPEEMLLVREKHMFMTQLGFDYIFEKTTVKVTHLPIYLHKHGEPTLLKSCLVHFCGEDVKNYILRQEDFHGKWLLYMKSLPKALTEAIISIACRLSIKFGQVLTSEEMTYLLKQLGACSLPFQCAHGRPTVVPMRNIMLVGNFADDYEI